MNILIVAATPIEISLFLTELKKRSVRHPDIDVLITGIGLTATTYSLMEQFRIKRPGLVIQAGVGGCFDKTIPLGKVLCIRMETIADQSVVELNKLKTLFDLKLVPQDKFPFKRGWLVNNNPEIRKVRLRKVVGISVNEITTAKEKVKFYRQKFNPIVESMEGAALHYVCLKEKIPFIQLRSVSNYIAERNKKNWNMKESIENLNEELIKIINSY